MINTVLIKGIHYASMRISNKAIKPIITCQTPLMKCATKKFIDDLRHKENETYKKVSNALKELIGGS